MLLDYAGTKFDVVILPWLPWNLLKWDLIVTLHLFLINAEVI